LRSVRALSAGETPHANFSAPAAFAGPVEVRELYFQPDPEEESA